MGASEALTTVMKVYPFTETKFYIVYAESATSVALATVTDAVVVSLL